MRIQPGSLQFDGSMWTFRSMEYNCGCYCTNNNGEGLFFQDDRTGNVRQLLGTCQFSACQTRSGMLRKAKRVLADLNHDPGYGPPFPFSQF